MECPGGPVYVLDLAGIKHVLLRQWSVSGQHKSSFPT